MSRRPPAYAALFDPLLTEDVEELLGRFQQRDSIRYQDFSSLWREMRFCDVFLGVGTQSELRRFCRVALATAVRYFLPPHSYQIRVGGLYLMFALYQRQLFKPPVNIRLALGDWAHAQTFLRDSVDSGHYDVGFIYQKLVFTKAFHYTAMPQPLTFQKQRKPKRRALCSDFLGRTTAVQDLLSANVLEEVKNVQELYQTLKQATVGGRSQVAVTHPDFASRLKDTMCEFLTWQEEKFPAQGSEKDGHEEEEPCSSRARLLSSIKQKGYSSHQGTSRPGSHTLELVDPAPRQGQRAAATRRKKPPSLRARTWKTLGVPQEDSVYLPRMTREKVE